MRGVDYRSISKFISSARAQLQAGSRVESRAACVGAAQSLQSGRGDGSWTAHHTEPCFSSPPQPLQPCPAHGSPSWTGSMMPSHGSSIAQHRSFASSRSTASGANDDDGPPSSPALDSSNGQEPEGDPAGQGPQQPSAAEQHRRSTGLWSVPTSAPGKAGGRGAAAPPEAPEGPWTLTEEQRQAERQLQAPPSGEPLYPDRRGSLAWEPFSDNNMEQEQEDYGGQINSIDEYDEMMDRWGELLEAGDTGGAIAMLEQRLPEMPEFDSNVGDYLASGTRREEIQEGRRLMETAIQEEYAARRVRTVDEQGRAYASGRRKSSIARVWIWEGPGSILINGRSLDMHFPQLNRRAEVLAPFQVTETLGFFDVRATVKGGGIMGQAQAIRHGISCALQKWDPELRPLLRQHGYLTRDPRVVERKKPGRAKARKAFQWVKR